MSLLGRRAAAVGLALSMLLAACSSEKTAEKPARTARPPAQAAPETEGESGKGMEVKYKPTHIPWDLDTDPVTIAGVTFNPASQWQVLGPHGEKKAFYKYDPVLGDSVGAELSIYHFGSERRRWQDIMNRWIEQMSYPDGRDPYSAAIRHDREVGGMTAHVLSILGTYHPPAEGFDREEAPTSPGHRIIAVAVEGPEGDVYFKLTGPDSTARVMTEAFMNMIYKLRPSSESTP
jgi:hypothetical protein